MGLLTKYGMSEQDAIGRAGLRAGLSYDNAAGSQQRQLSRMGVNPNSGRFAGLIQQQQYDKASGMSGAMNDAAADWRNYMANLAGQDAGIEQRNRSLDMQQQQLDTDQNWAQKSYYDKMAEERSAYNNYNKNQQSGLLGNTSTATKKTGLLSSSLWGEASSLGNSGRTVYAKKTYNTNDVDQASFRSLGNRTSRF